MSFFSDLSLWIRTPRKPFALVSEALPHTRTINNTQWWLADTEWLTSAEKISGGLNNGWCEHLDVPILKRSGSRSLFILPGPPRQCVVKSFNFRTSFGRRIFRHRLFGRDEAISLLLAKGRGIPVPALYAYAETRSGIMCLDSIQLIEHINGHVYPEFIQTTDATAAQGLLRVADLMLKLYHGGCLHPDPHYEQFLLSPAGAQQDRILDFQYAQFGAPSVNQLVYQCAHFFRSLNAHQIHVENTLIEQTIRYTLETINLSQNDLIRWKKQFYTFYAAHEDMERRQIMQLK